MGVGVQSEGGIGVSQDPGQGLGVHPAGQSMGGKGVTKLVEATNGHFLVEAENEIWYDIARGYSLHCSLFH